MRDQKFRSSLWERGASCCNGVLMQSTRRSVIAVSRSHRYPREGPTRRDDLYAEFRRGHYAV